MKDTFNKSCLLAHLDAAKTGVSTFAEFEPFSERYLRVPDDSIARDRHGAYAASPSVRNRTDESLEAMLQGSPPPVLAEMCDWMRNGYAAALVGDIQGGRAFVSRFNRIELYLVSL
ncbi:acylphosphatase [Cupriavidus necator]|uniref:Acylphosphatase n=1 Tax=Cupriavidus necator TaxID=106590 RepID=A0A1U9UUQ3_CUPNE|nr:acylphosphatase [Cupriavidus necator]